MTTTIYIGADHAGFHLKESLVEHFKLQGLNVVDLGALSLDPNDDYPVYARLVASAVLEDLGSIGVLCCGNAQGVAIVANKFDGIRAGIGYSKEVAMSMREEDNVNVLCLPGRSRLEEDPLAIADVFLGAAFLGKPRYERRLSQIEAIEEVE